MRLLLKSLLAVFLIAFLSSCESDDPDSLGIGLVPDNDKPKLVTVSSDSLDWNQYSYSYTYDSLNLGTSERLLLGKFISNDISNPYSIKSHILVKWYISLADSIIEQIDSGELTVNSAWMTLKPTYNKANYNDLDFSIYRINEDWDQTDFYFENLKDLDKGTDDLFNGFLEVNGKTDSLISFKFSNDLADSWLQVKADTSFPDKNYGVLFSPNNMKSNIGFCSANASITDYNPTLYIEYNRIIDSTGYEYVDTISSTLVLADTHVNEIIDGNIILNKDNKFVLHTGVATLTNFFIDVSELPENAVINRADLFFSVDTNHSQYGSVRSDTLYAVAYSDSTADEISSLGGILYYSGGVYSGEITGLVQNWVNGVDNQGVVFNLSDASRSISRVELYGSNTPDIASRPKVKIVYTTIPGQ